MLMVFSLKFIMKALLPFVCLFQLFLGALLILLRDLEMMLESIQLLRVLSMHLLQLLVVQRLQSIPILLVLLQILLLVLLHLPEILIK